MAQPFDSGKAQLSGDVFPVGEGISFGAVNNFAPVSVSANGVLLYWTGSRRGAESSQISWYDRGGKLLEMLVPQSGVLMPAISPDEKTIAFSRGTWSDCADSGRRRERNSRSSRCRCRSPGRFRGNVCRRVMRIFSSSTEPCWCRRFGSRSVTPLRWGLSAIASRGGKSYRSIVIF